MLHISGIIIAILVYLYEREYQKNKRFAKRMQENAERKDKLNADLLSEVINLTNLAKSQKQLLNKMNAERKGIYKMYDN